MAKLTKQMLERAQPTLEELETRFALGLREHIIGSLETHVDRTLLLYDWEEANPPSDTEPALGLPEALRQLAAEDDLRSKLEALAATVHGRVVTEDDLIQVSPRLRGIRRAERRLVWAQRFYAYGRALHDALSAIDKEYPCDTPEGVAALLRAAARFTVDVNQGKYIPEAENGRN